MKFVLFLLRSIAKLPLKVLYMGADCLFVLLYYILRYRRKVVRENLHKCFPDKSEEWHRIEERKFYHNFADYIVETIKLLHISDEEMSQRMSWSGLELIEDAIERNQDVLIYFSHCGCWEWAPSVTLHLSEKVKVCTDCAQVYRPLKSKTFDKIMLTIRSRFGSLSFPKSTVLRDLIKLRRSGRHSVTGFMSDQKPSKGDPTVPIMFLEQPTAFISGTEALGRRLGMTAIYWDISKPQRGHYHIDCRLIAKNIADTPEQTPTRIYAGMLEQTITRNPSIWLWSHKRWKIPATTPTLTVLPPQE